MNRRIVSGRIARRSLLDRRLLGPRVVRRRAGL
jgi:hypothetical protein